MTIAKIVKMEIAKGLQIIPSDEFLAHVYKHGENLGEITYNCEYVEKKQVCVLDGPGYHNLTTGEQRLLDTYVQNNKW